MSTKANNELSWPSTQAVLLTVPPFPMHRQDIRVFASARLPMSNSSFKWALRALLDRGLVRPGLSLTGAVMKDHFFCDHGQLRTAWRKPARWVRRASTLNLQLSTP